MRSTETASAPGRSRSRPRRAPSASRISTTRASSRTAATPSAADAWGRGLDRTRPVPSAARQSRRPQPRRGRRRPSHAHRSRRRRGRSTLSTRTGSAASTVATPGSSAGRQRADGRRIHTPFCSGTTRPNRRPSTRRGGHPLEKRRRHRNECLGAAVRAAGAAARFKWGTGWVVRRKHDVRIRTPIIPLKRERSSP